MDKVINGGKVAVLHSAGYGAGWYTWNDKHKECLFDPEIVGLVLAGGDDNYNSIAEIADSKWPGFYTGGIRDLRIEWVPEGKAFQVTEYDGYESVELMSDIEYLIA